MLMLRGYESERYAKPIDNSSPEVDGLGILLNFDDFSTYPTVDQIYRYHFDTPVTDADPPPLHYFFVLDYSQSMNYPFAGLNYGDRAKTDGERWKACEQAIEKLQDTASDKDFATLIRFDGGDLDDLGYEPVFGFFPDSVQNAEEASIVDAGTKFNAQRNVPLADLRLRIADYDPPFNYLTPLEDVDFSDNGRVDAAWIDFSQCCKPIFVCISVQN